MADTIVCHLCMGDGECWVYDEILGDVLVQCLCENGQTDLNDRPLKRKLINKTDTAWQKAMQAMEKKEKETNAKNNSIRIRRKRRAD